MLFPEFPAAWPGHPGSLEDPLRSLNPQRTRSRVLERLDREESEAYPDAQAMHE